MEKAMKLKRNTHGFTLVEIMIVVAIIGLLAAIAVPNFMQARTSARTSTCVNNLRLISAAKDQSALENGLADSATPTTTQLSPYLKSTNATTGLPTEPTGGTYTINEVSVRPTCSVGGTHVVS